MHTFTVLLSILLVFILCGTSATDWSLSDETAVSSGNEELQEIIQKYDNQTGDLVQGRLKQNKMQIWVRFLFGFYIVDWQQFG